MALLAILHDNGRAAERHALATDATLRAAEQPPADVFVVDLSETGCLFACAEPLGVGDTITIGIAGIGKRQGRIVRAAEQHYACAFTAPLTMSDLKAVLAAPADVIVPFPQWARAQLPAEAAAPAIAVPIAGLPGWARIGMVSALALLPWLGLAGLRGLIS